MSIFHLEKWRERGRKGEIRSKRRKIKLEHRSRNVRERETILHLCVTLSYGINGGLMGYEGLFYWKQ